MSQVWLITGASRGLGRAIAQAVLEARHSVVATSRAGAVDDALIAYGERLLVLPLDVKTPGEAAYEHVVAAAVAQFGRIDVLVNNAGYGLLNFFEETDEEQVRDVFETNLFGLMRMTRAVLPVMRQQRAGHIINMSSMAGYIGGSAMYSTTKFAVTGFTESLAFELAPFGIKATNVGPGYFRTDFLDGASVQHRPAKVIADYAPAREMIAGFIAHKNHSQEGDPAALARLIVAVAASSNPPVHLLAGSDAMEGVAARNHTLMTDVEAWREESAATRF